MASTSKVEVYAGGIPEIVLNSVVELIAEVAEQVIDLGRPEGNVLANRDIHAAAKRHCKSVSARSSRESASSYYWLADGFKSVAMNVGMCSPK